MMRCRMSGCQQRRRRRREEATEGRGSVERSGIVNCVVRMASSALLFSIRIATFHALCVLLLLRPRDATVAPCSVIHRIVLPIRMSAVRDDALMLLLLSVCVRSLSLRLPPLPQLQRRAEAKVQKINAHCSNTECSSALLLVLVQW